MTLDIFPVYYVQRVRLTLLQLPHPLLFTTTRPSPLGAGLFGNPFLASNQVLPFYVAESQMLSSLDNLLDQVSKINCTGNCTRADTASQLREGLGEERGCL